MATAVETRPGLSHGDTDRERLAHIVEGKDRVTRAYVTGEPVVALCGKRWIPSRDPHGLPVCAECRAELEARRAAGR
jgi:hypothetical protein